jgi:hypothetical protein
MNETYARLTSEITTLRTQLDYAADAWGKDAGFIEESSDEYSSACNPQIEDQARLGELGSQLSCFECEVQGDRSPDFIPCGLSCDHGYQGGGDRMLLGGENEEPSRLSILDRDWPWHDWYQQESVPSHQGGTRESERTLSNRTLGETWPPRSPRLQDCFRTLKRERDTPEEEELRRTEGLTRIGNGYPLFFSGTKEILPPCPKKVKKWRVIYH